MEPTASPVLMDLRSFHVTVVRDGEPQHLLLSAGEEALPQELTENQSAPEQPVAEKTSQEGQGKEQLSRREGSGMFWGEY